MSYSMIINDSVIMDFMGPYNYYRITEAYKHSVCVES